MNNASLTQTLTRSHISLDMREPGHMTQAIVQVQVINTTHYKSVAVANVELTNTWLFLECGKNT